MKRESYYYWPREASYVHCSDTGPRTYTLGNWYHIHIDSLTFARLHRVPDLALLLDGVATG